MRELIYGFRNRYSKMSLPVKAGFWFTVCNFLQRAITMITTPIFSRVLPEEEYGIISTFSSWQNILLLVTSLALYKAMMNLYVKYKDKEMVLSAITGLSLLLTTIWFAVFILFDEKVIALLGLSKALCYCLFISFITQGVLQCWMTYKRYCFEYAGVVGVTLVNTILTSAAGLVCVILVSATAESRLIPQTVISTIIVFGLCYSIFRENKTIYHRDIWKFSLGFCVCLMPHYLSEFVLQSSDKLMINYMCGARDVALYSIAYAVGSLINLITSAINASFAPYQYQKIEQKAYKELALTANNVLILVAVMLAGIMLFSREIVLVFGGSKYIESVQVIIPICIGIYFNYVFQMFARVQEYYNHKLSVVIPSICCAALNVVLNYICIKAFGYQAAAYTTFVCYLVFCIMHYLFYSKLCSKELNGVRIYDVKGIVLISGVLIIIGLIIAFINQYIIFKYIIVLCIALIMFVTRKKIVKYVTGTMQQTKE